MKKKDKLPHWKEGLISHGNNCLNKYWIYNEEKECICFNQITEDGEFKHDRLKRTSE